MANVNPIEIVDYDPQWPHSFNNLRNVIARALGDLVLTIEHVGSTAVPNLPAKPIIDIDVVIESDAQLLQVVKRLIGLGYVHQGDLGITRREAFKRLGIDVPRDGSGRSWPQHHLYVCPKDSPELGRHLAFRDRLRAQPDAARKYRELKKQLARQNAVDRESYWRGKTDFIEGILTGMTS
jgi:GrpB-like predicted nucleotidyltransferase (UPF0157 family)